MSVINLLSEKDKELIDQYIHEYAPGASAWGGETNWYRWVGIDKVLEPWAIAKNNFLNKIFKDSLILRRPYVYTANVEGLTKDIGDHFKDPEYQTMNNWWQKMKQSSECDIEVFQPDGITPFNSWLSKWYFVNHCFEANTLAANAYNEENLTIVFKKSGKKMKLFKGMKPMKIIRRFIEEANGPEDIFDAFRNWHSRLLNQKHMDGELCLSIHPLDYMTMSDNDSNWQSCMRWAHGHGDYRAGTLECLNSPYIIVAYLHNPSKPWHDENDYGWTWNNKQWRELFIVQEGVINEIKGYPYQDENLTNTCLMWIKELAEKELNWTYEPEEKNVKKEIPYGNDEIYLSFDPTQYMYNDMGTLNIHRGRINPTVLLDPHKYHCIDRKYPQAERWSYIIDVPYGGTATCMCCGNVIDLENATTSVLCEECDAVRRCACCGEVIYDDSESYWIEEKDDYVCYDCWCDNSMTDALTGESHLNENMTEIRLLLGYDDAENPVWYDNTFWCYEPEYNYYWDKLFTSNVKSMEVNRWEYNYVTLDMIRENECTFFCDIFDVYPRVEHIGDVITSYLDVLYYDTNMNPLFEEED